MTADPVAAYVAGREFRMLIDGEFADAGQAAVGEVPVASPADVTAAVAAAGAAQPAWQALGVDGRAECFRRFGELLSERREELAMLDALDSGNPVRAMRIDIDLCKPYLAGWPQLARWLSGEVIPGGPGRLHYT